MSESEFEFILDPYQNMNPTVRPDYTSNVIVDEIRELNRLLVNQLDEMKCRIELLEQFILHNETIAS